MKFDLLLIAENLETTASINSRFSAESDKSTFKAEILFKKE